ncbi:hypothetical protein [Dehalobacter sp.]|uniref:hypothetical protein n=1 Tax=Dehalobacter sp. TaxID=1962289 RepID=UPI00258DE076|nr:hypothetical protein [Dehalobacter sp.]MCG1026294.1 hypothetical protein [Dehalobacter sp.]
MRKTIEIPEDIHDWYVKTAKEMAMPTSALMVFGLKNYIDQQKSLVNIEDVMRQLKELKQKNE